MVDVEMKTSRKRPPPLDLTHVKEWPETAALQQAIDTFAHRLEKERVPGTRAEFLETVRAMACYGVLAHQCDCTACIVTMDEWMAEYGRWKAAGGLKQAPEPPPYMYPYRVELRDNGVKCLYRCLRSGEEDGFYCRDTVPLTDVPLDPEAPRSWGLLHE